MEISQTCEEIGQPRKEAMAKDSGIMGGVVYMEVMTQLQKIVMEMELITFISIWRY